MNTFQTLNNKQEEGKGDSQNIKPVKKLNPAERFKKMLEEQKNKEKEKVQRIKMETKKQNSNLATNNLVKNAIENEKKNQEELRQKKLQSEKEEKEREAQRRNTMIKISEQQKAKKLKDDERKMKEAEEKKIKEEQKKEKDKKWKEEMDRDRIKYTISDYNNINDLWRESAYNIIKSNSNGFKGKIYEEQETKIFIDLTNELSQYIISEYDKNIIKEQFQNCLSYYEINNKNCKCELLKDNLKRQFNKGKAIFSVNKGDINWEIMELLLEYILNCKIKFDFLEECSILFAEPINCTRCDREKIAQILFEDYNFQKIFIIKPSILTLLSEGKYTGIVAELQDDISNYIPIFDGYSLPHATIKSNLCRKDVLQYMKELEFYPKINSKNNFAINLNDAIKKCDKDIQNELYNNIILTGVNSNFPGIKEIMSKEIYNLVPGLMENQIRVSCNEEIQKGMESFFSDSKYEQMWIQKEEYEEYGADVVRRKCF